MIPLNPRNSSDPDAPSSFFGREGSFDERQRLIRANFPSVVFMETPGRARTFHPDHATPRLMMGRTFGRVMVELAETRKESGHPCRRIGE